VVEHPTCPTMYITMSATQYGGFPEEARKFFVEEVAKKFHLFCDSRGHGQPYREEILSAASAFMEGKVADKDRALLKRAEGAFGGDDNRTDRQIRFSDSEFSAVGTLGIHVQDHVGGKYSDKELSAILEAFAKALEVDFARRFGWTTDYFNPDKEQESFQFSVDLAQGVKLTGSAAMVAAARAADGMTEDAIIRSLKAAALKAVHEETHNTEH